MDKGNKGEEALRMAGAVLVHPQPAIVRLGAFERFDHATDSARPGSRRLSESLKAEVNPGVAHAAELEEVVEMPDMALGLAVPACWRHSECCAVLYNYPIVDSVVMVLS
ncbi:hypothetical protein Aspvir_004956 [Aspergillus viridinutans]|uniref:Uncharacterized protein n=1 Tax=Aspergillus viridinutans TaxID=75553 RepID=A0A9P3F4C8_ASPVI|nr:uncharacterized protein Aspvir_004956 [Aspergillus viridinutans]GIK00926.1 hypothetical protein Aspvir_004956 [Aspergillus viridinutans]